MRQYILSVTVVCILSGVLLSLFREGTVMQLLRMVCGILLIITAIGPLSGKTIPEILTVPDHWLPDGEAAAAMGADLARRETRRCIQQRLEAYILDKAQALGADITPTVELDAENYPESIELEGDCSEDIRQTLSSVITNDLGIPEEDQKWTGRT